MAKKKSKRPPGRPRIYPPRPEIVAKDFFGYVMKVGDKVIAIPPGERYFVKAIITKFTPKMVWIKYKGYDNQVHEIRLFHEQVVDVDY